MLLQNLLYKLLVKLTGHADEKINEEKINSWLINSYRDDGFKNYLTSKYAFYSRRLTTAYRGDDEYRGVIAKLTVLRSLELDAKKASEESEENKRNAST